MTTQNSANTAFMLDAQANLWEVNQDNQADSQQSPMIAASDWQLDAKAAQTALMEKMADKVVGKSAKAEADLKPLKTLEVLWVPTELVVFSQAVVPGKRAADALKALPYVLEANLALAIEDYFIVVLQKQKVTEPVAGFEFTVALVAHAQMQLWQQALQALELTDVLLVADCFRLPPAAQPQKYCRDQAEHTPTENVQDSPNARCLLRLNQYSGFACPAAWGESVWQLTQATAQQNAPQKLQVGDEPSVQQSAEQSTQNASELTAKSPLSFAQLPSVSPQDLLGGQLASLPAGDKLHYRQLNLLQAEYSNQTRYSGWTSIAATAAVLVLSLSALLLLQTQHETKQLQAQTERYQQQTQQLFEQMFPEVKRIVNIKAQTISRLKSQAKVEQQADLLAWLSAVESLMSMVPEVSVERLEWNGARQHLKLALSAKNSQQLARLSTLAKQNFAQYPISIATQSVQPNQIEAQLNVR